MRGVEMIAVGTHAVDCSDEGGAIAANLGAGAHAVVRVAGVIVMMGGVDGRRNFADDAAFFTVGFRRIGEKTRER